MQKHIKEAEEIMKIVKAIGDCTDMSRNRIIAPTTIGKEFAEVVIELSDGKGMTESECYKAAQVTRQTWNQLKNGKRISNGAERVRVNPTKDTAILFAIALRLNEDETQMLLHTAGYCLSQSDPRDVTITTCIRNNVYDVVAVAQILEKLKYKSILPMG